MHNVYDIIKLICFQSHLTWLQFCLYVFVPIAVAKSLINLAQDATG